MRAPRLAARVRPRRSCATVPPSSFSPRRWRQRSTAARPISRRTTRPGRAWIFGSGSGDRVTAPQRTLLVLIGLHAQPLIAQRHQLRQGVFGFANAEGTELLALDSVSNPTQIRGAVCAGGRVYRVAYARRQSRCHELPILGSGVGHVRARCFKPTGDCGPPSRSRCSTQEAARE